MFLIGLNFLTTLATLLSANLPLVYTRGIQGEIRLVGGIGDYEGRVEIYLHGGWGTICDDNWDQEDAIVACRQLGFRTAITTVSSAGYGPGTGPVWLYYVQCRGNEHNILSCSNPHPGGLQICGHQEDAGVKCEVPVRLVDGTTDDEGRIEIFLNGAWGTICDDSWGIDEADVACRQLGYTSAVAATSSASYGQGTGQIWLDDVQCDGSEENFLACNNRGVGVHNCVHGEDAGVKCQFTEIRLVGGTTYYEGRIEIFVWDIWGTICDHSWGKDEADVACRQLGYSAAEVATSSASYGQGTSLIWLDDVQCIGSEEHILDCNNRGVGVHNCGHHEDAGVKCEIPIRLVNGEGIHTGRVELFMNGEWGTVDEDPWDDTDAGVVCRELGFLYGGTGYRRAHFGQGTGPIWIDSVRCEGQETRLLRCPHQTDTSEDSHEEDVGVACNGPLRLVGGTTYYEGRIEIFMNGAWGTICDHSWGMDDANVACRQLGYSAAVEAVSSASYGEGSGEILLDDVQCIGSEEHILACQNSGVGVHKCGHHEDAGVKCEIPTRLVNGEGIHTGRVELFMNGEWGTVDEDPWDDTDAGVVCRELGFPYGGTGYRRAHFGQGTGPIWIDSVNCEGQETRLLQCRHYTDTSEDSHEEDVGVACNGPRGY